MGRTVMDILQSEWEVVGNSRRAIRQMEGLREVELNRFRTPANVVKFANEQSHPIESDHVLACLAKHAGNDALAARTLLQAVLPGLKALASSYAHRGSSDDVASQVVAIATERICTYPYITRPSRIAANVILDTRRQMWNQRECIELDLRPDLTVAAVIPEPSPGEEVMSLISTAVRSGAISKDAGRIILQSRVMGYGIDEIAAMEGESYLALRQRKSRAERVLMKAGPDC